MRIWVARSPSAAASRSRAVASASPRAAAPSRVAGCAGGEGHERGVAHRKLLAVRAARGRRDRRATVARRASVSGATRSATTRDRIVGSSAPGSLDVRDDGRVRRRLLEQLEERVGRDVAARLRLHLVGVADDEHLPRGDGGGERGVPHQRSDRVHEDPLEPDGWGVQSVLRGALAARFGVHVEHFLGGGVADAVAQVREEPTEIGVRELQRVAAGDAGAARAIPVGRADEELADPEREPLLAHAARAVEEQAGGQAAARDGLRQALAQRVVAVEREDGHDREYGVVLGEREAPRDVRRRRRGDTFGARWVSTDSRREDGGADAGRWS